MCTLSSERSQLSKSKTLRLLDELETAAGPAISLYIQSGLSGTEIDEMFRIASSLNTLPLNPIKVVEHSATGAVLFWGEQRKYLILPPFPIEESRASDGYDVEPLRSLLRREFTIALVLVRLGAYAVGVFQGDKLVSSKVGTGLVHSRHKKGGSSQRRFERHREKQMQRFFDRICTHVQNHLEPHLQQLDYVIYGGERNTLLSFRKRCVFPRASDSCTLGLVLNVREPKQATLEAAIAQAWCSNAIHWY